MQWRGVGIILSVKHFSENSRIVTIFSESIGKSSGLVRDLKSSIQLGDICDVTWSGRTSEHLGSFKIETIFSPFCHVFKDASGLLAISSACAMCKNGLPDRAAHQLLFESLKSFLLSVAKGNWIVDYVFFEISLLSEVGFGLNLSKCAVSGEIIGLRYVSPKTGCAVTQQVGEKYRDKLFLLPGFMASGDRSGLATKYDIFCALNITGHFLKIYFYGINGKGLPLARDYLLESVNVLGSVA
jgi:DNA repair protein RecO (recombination protein O)